jgi:hypothetical protein
MVISNTRVFLQRFIYPRTAAASSSVAIVGATPYKSPGSKKQLARSGVWFHFEKEIKGRWCEIRQIMELGEHLDVNGTAEKLCTEF